MIKWVSAELGRSQGTSLKKDRFPFENEIEEDYQSPEPV